MSPGAVPSVTFVGHDATRTGAPMVLLSVLRWLAGRGGARPRVVLVDGGPLEAEFAALAPCTVLGSRWRDGVRVLDAGLRSVGAPFGAPDPVTRRRLRSLPATDIVVANTLAALPVARAIAGTGHEHSRLVCHVHELDGVAVRLLPADPGVRHELLHRVDAFVAAGRLVAEMLVARLGVSPAQVHVVDEFIDRPRPDAGRVAEVRAAWFEGPERPVVIDVGAMNRRKAPERFIDLMTLLASHPTTPLGVWLGGEVGGAVWAETAADVRRSGVSGSIVVTPNVEDPVSRVAGADVLVSTAIEDPFPLAVLEAAALGVPVVGFDSGGLADVLRGAGLEDHVCGMGDLLAMRDRVAGLLEDPAGRTAAGERLQEWVCTTHLTEHLAPRLWQVIAS